MSASAPPNITIPTEAQSSQVGDNLYNPKNFYNLHGAGFGIWLVCIVAGNLIPELTPIWFKVIAITLSIMVSIVILVESGHSKEFKYQALVIFNTALIFINASGINAITYSSNNSDLTFKQTDENIRVINKSNKEAGIIFIDNQKNWWQDHKVKYERDSYAYENKIYERKLDLAKNQMMFLRDWLQDKFKTKEGKKLFNQMSPFLGKYSLDSSDVAILQHTHEKQKEYLQFKIDSLKIRLKTEINTKEYTTIGNRQMTTSQWVDTLLEENYSLTRKVAFLKANSKLPEDKIDSLLKKYTE